MSTAIQDHPKDMRRLRKRQGSLKSLLAAPRCAFLSCSILLLVSSATSAFRHSRLPFGKWNEIYGGRHALICYATPHSADTTKKRKKQDKHRQPKSAVDDLVAKMGLKPVPKKTKIKQDNSHSHRMASMKEQLDYARDGHCVLRNYIDPWKLEPIRKELLALGEEEQLKAWRQKVQVASGSRSVPEHCKTINDCRKALEQLGVPSDSLPFLQYFNTWRKLASVKQLAMELAQTAAHLLDVPSVRLYQDSFFWKRSQDGPTPWHVDARMAPFDTPSMLTIWIPLHDIPRDGSALHFVSKSHADFALPFWYPYTTDQDSNPWNHLEDRYEHNKIVNYMPMSAGDVTVHSGWTLHCADGQVAVNDREEAFTDRLALAISYVDARAPVRANVLDESDHGDDEDRWSYAEWVKQVPAGRCFEHPLVPIVWPH